MNARKGSLLSVRKDIKVLDATMSIEELFAAVKVLVDNALS